MRYRLLLTGLLAPALLAQPGEASAETMTVTAYRTEQPLARAGSAVSIVDRRLIEERQAATAAEALRGLPGLAFARSGPVGAQTQLRVRGAEANHVMVLIDGVEANDVATDDAFSFEHLTTADIERIEVVRGPQSALWGSDTLAGVINVVTRQPTQSLESDVFAEGGSFGFANGGARVGVRGERAAVTGNISHLRTDGTNAARHGAEDDAYDNTTGSLAVTADPLPGLRLDASLRHTDANVEYDALDYVDGVLVAVDADNQTDIRHRYARFGGALDLADGRWQQQLHYGITRTDTDSRAEVFPGSYDTSSTEGGKYGVYYQSSLKLGTSALADILTLAVSHERQEFRQRGTPSPWGDPNQDQRLYNTGYALEYLALIGARLTLSASARHDANSDFEDANTWRTTAAWQMSTAARLHASVGTGQKAPTFFERFGFTPDTFVGNPDLDPETSTGWDAGIEYQWLGGRLTTDITYFRAKLDDEINGFFCPPPVFACTAVNESVQSRRRGVETTLTARLSDAWHTTASHTYTDAEEGEPRRREVRRPLHAAAIDLTGRLADGRMTVNLAASYTGSRLDDSFLSAPPFVERVRLDDYTLLALAASYEVRPGITLYGRIENALDEGYEDVFGFDTPGAGAFAGIRVKLPRQ
jgi:vitamin B12 transporter